MPSSLSLFSHLKLGVFIGLFCSTALVHAQTSGCTYPAACNFTSAATVDDGSCVFPEPNYDCLGNCLLDLNNNGLCDLEETVGCTNIDAINYMPIATLDDGSCMVTCKGDFNNDGVINANDLLSFLAVFGTTCTGGGCMNPAACNYDPSATYDFGYCEFPEEFYDCDGVCQNDADGDGVCDELEVPGCTDTEASNYNPEATEDDGSCSTGQPQYPAGSVFCTGTPTEVVEVINPTTGKIWMDRNLGAAEAFDGTNTEAAAGDLYQWGRGPDGHQCRTSTFTSTLSSTDQPGHNMFIIINGGNYDWRNPQSIHLWQSSTGINIPCPEGFRLPTEAEATEERLTWATNNIAGATASPIKWAPTGRRSGTTSNILAPGEGNNWTSTIGTVSSVMSKALLMGTTNASMAERNRSDGRAVRCIKE